MPITESIQKAFEPYIDFDFLSPLSPPRKKKDGAFYSTYITELKEECTWLPSERRTIILKELSSAQQKIYQQLSTLWCPYTESIYGVITVENQYFAVSEFIPKPTGLPYCTAELAEKRNLSLEHYISRFGCLTESDALIFLLQLCEGLESLSRLGLIHGDVSPQNILLTDRPSYYPQPYKKIKGLHQDIILKLIDFDITSEKKDQNHLVTVVAGTNPYAAPEILDYKNPTDRVDIYSLGCILSFMLTGKSPKQMPQEEFRQKCSLSARNIINKCTSDYYQRYKSISQLKQALHAVLFTSRLPFGQGLCHIPGYRSGKPWKMCTAAIGYSFLFHLLIFVICPNAEFWAAIPTLLLSFLLTFDVFHLGCRSHTYQNYADRMPWLRYAVKFILGIILPFFVLGYLIS